MDEQVVAEGDAELQAFEKAEMRLGKGLGKGLAPCFGRRPQAIEPLRIDAIGEHGRVAAIAQVRAKYDYLAGADLKAFEQRAAALKGLPPLNVEKLYVITEDDQLRNGEMVLFIGLRVNCVTTVFGLPTRLYRELVGRSENI